MVLNATIENQIGMLQLHDPSTQNALTPHMVTELEAAVMQLSTHPLVRVILLYGLPSVFCSGADKDTLLKIGNGTILPVDIRLSKVFLDIPIPVISAMEGHAIGGGLALGCCADMAFIALESRYGCSFMNMGFTPGMGSTKLLEHFMGPAISQELLYGGEFKKGRTLLHKTHFNGILTQKEVFPAALNLATRIAEKPRESLLTLKRYLSMSRRKTFEETYTLESMMHDITFRKPTIFTEITENYV
jgi:polyketide biosynthesis enoyl-CoA hydratase PksI